MRSPKTIKWVTDWHDGKQTPDVFDTRDEETTYYIGKPTKVETCAFCSETIGKYYTPVEEILDTPQNNLITDFRCCSNECAQKFVEAKKVEHALGDDG